MGSEADKAWNEMLGRQASATSHQASAEGREALGTSHEALGEGKKATPSASPLASAAKWGAVALLGLIAIAALTWVILSNRTRPAITPAPPAPSPSAGAPTAPSSPAPTTAQLDLNTATAAQLEQLPGIGPSLAARIIADRDKHGRYTTIDQLDRVDGIGPKTIEKLKPYLTVK